MDSNFDGISGFLGKIIFFFNNFSKSLILILHYQFRFSKVVDFQTK